MADEHTLTWTLSDPGMDILERAGLAGLYMALQAAEEKDRDFSPLSWELKPDSVTVRWTGPARRGFEKLMEWAWQVTKKDGVLYLPGVHDEYERANFHLRVPTHTGIMRTFLQHTNVQPKGETIHRIVKLEENREISVSFQPPIIRPPKKKKSDDDDETEPRKLLRVWGDLESLFSGVDFKVQAALSSWAFPGIGGRYGEEKKGKAWKGTTHVALLLMLAPTVCLFQRLPKTEAKIKEKRVWIDNWVFVVPDVRELEEFAVIRRQMSLNADFVDVASMGDAGLQFFAEYASQKPRQALAGCRVVAMGKVSYYANQSIRKAVLDVTADPHQVDRYRSLHKQFPNVYVALRHDEEKGEQGKPSAKGKRPAKAKKPAADEPPKAAGFIKLPAARGRIADNLVNHRPWYENLSIPMTWDRDELERQRKRNKELNDRDGGNRATSHETILFQSLQFQRRKLMKLIKDDVMWDTEAEKVFVEAFWETLRSLYRREGDAAKDRGGSRTAGDRMEDLNEEVRRSLVQAKTHALLRERLAEFFARPVKKFRSPNLAKNVSVVWRLVDTDWKKGRDLALLALASYMSEEKRNPTPSIEGG